MYQKLKDIDAVRDQLRGLARLEDIAHSMYGIELRASGQDDMKACCPFHKEDTPSFGIRKSSQLYHCFGCKAGGDLFKFVQEMDSIEHMEAIRKIAEHVGFDLSPFKEAYTTDERRLQDYYNLNKDVAEFAVLDGSGEVANFAKSRRLERSVLRDFSVGYTKSLGQADIPAASDAEAKALEFSHVGKWENRLCIPVHDHFGRIAGFRNKDIGGHSKVKIIGPGSTHPLPVPEIYGLHLARKHARRDGFLILVEGEVDVWQMVAAGYKNTAGMMGSKFNDKMVKELESLSISNVVIIPDNDDAGRKFARALVNEYRGKYVNVKVATLTGNGKDPDEVLLADGTEAIDAAIASAKHAFEYLVDRVCDDRDVKSRTDQLDILNDLKEFMAGASAIIRELTVRKVADMMQVDYETVLDFYRESNEKDEQAPMHNMVAEKVVLKKMLEDDEFVGDCLLSLNPTDFYLSKHRAVFEAIGKLYRKQEIINEDTVRTYVENTMGEGARSLFASITSDSVDVSSCSFMLDDLRDKALRRDVQKVARDTANRLAVSKIDAKDTVQALSAHLAKSLVGGGSRPVDVGSIVAQRMSLMHQRIKNPNAIIGIDLGPDFPVLNNTLHGLQTSRYAVVSAPSGSGKTAFAGVIAKRAAIQLGMPTLFFSFETGAESITDRLISNIAGVQSDKIVTGYIDENEAALVHNAAELIAASPLVITERGIVYEDCVSIIRHDVLKRGTKLVVVDYIQLMQMSGAGRDLRRDQELGQISRGFLELAKALDIAILVLAQQNRDAVKGGSNEGTGIGESFKIYQDSDIFITFREKTKEELDADGIDRGNRKGLLAKHRHGRGGVSFNMIADLDVMRLSEVTSVTRR